MINLQLNYPSVSEEAAILGDFMREFCNYRGSLAFPDYQGEKYNLDAAIQWLKVPEGIVSEIADIVAFNSGNHALSCILNVLAGQTSGIISEPFTYPAFKALALKKGFKIHASDFDGDGLTVMGIEKVAEQTNSRLVYLQPTIQNRVSTVMPMARRLEVAEMIKLKDLILIEDDAYRFLHPQPPLRFLDLIPENTIHISSLSKSFNPLIKTAYAVLPAGFVNAVIDEVRLTSSGNSALLSSFATHIMESDALEEVIVKKRLRATELQRSLMPLFNGSVFRMFPTGFHAWITLPRPTKRSCIENSLIQKGVMVSMGSDFAVNRQTGDEEYIRVALNTKYDIGQLAVALAEVAGTIKKVC